MMKKCEKLDISDINNAFSPTQEIVKPEQFIGRYEEIEESIVSLATSGAFMAIFGIRGIGKSSIANQIKLIAEGDKTLVKKAQLEHLLPRKGFNFMVHLIRCDYFVKDIPILLNRILLGDDYNPSIFSHNKEGNKRVTTYKETLKAKGGLDIKIIKGSLASDEEKTFEVIKTDDLVQEFKQALLTTRKDNQDKTGLLIIIDEFDIIENKNGFASLIKTCSSDYIKFGIVGIGDSMEDLIEDHSSISRQINNINIKSMPEKELKEIIKLAENKLKNQIKFSDDVVNEIVKEAEGFPYFVHLFGKETLLLTFKRSKKIVDLAIYNEVKERLFSGLMPITQEYKYTELCRTSAERELILKLFSDVEDNYILTEDVYKQARDYYNIKEPSQYINELKQINVSNPVLIESRDGRHYRFSDPTLKIYAKKRNSIHDKYISLRRSTGI